MKKINSSKIKRIIYLIIFAFSLLKIIKIYTDYLEVQEIGYNFIGAFWINFMLSILAGIIIFVLTFLIIFINLFILKKNLVLIDSEFSYLKKSFPLFFISLIISITTIFLIDNNISHQLLNYINSQSFGFGDPVFYRDVGYYIFQRPFLMAMLETISLIFVFALILSTGVYAILYAKFNIYEFKRIFKQGSFVLHMAIQFACILVTQAFLTGFRAQNMLFGEQGGFSGAGFTDIKVWQLYYSILPYLLVGIAMFLIFFALRLTKRRWLIITIASYPTFWLIALMIAWITQSLHVVPNRVSAQEKYVANNIYYTRMAYNLDKVVELDFPLAYDLNGQKIMNNSQTINNIPLNNQEITLKTLNKTQIYDAENYRFQSASVAPYILNSGKTLVSLSARELSFQSNDTHGMGVVANPQGTASEDGQPYLIMKDIPPRAFEGMTAISEPRIYYGESNSHSYIVDNDQAESGIHLNFFNRLIFSLRYLDIFPDGNRLLTNRNVIERVNKVAPFLTVDNSSLLTVTENGELKWVVDLYTTSSYFPYSRKSDGKNNYIRNSAKAVVDAYDGSVKFYLTDTVDPIIRSFVAAYPGFFEHEEIPEEFMRYPEYLFKQQASIYAQYSVTDPREFLSRQGALSFARERYETDKHRDISPAYSLVKLNGLTNSEEFVISVPYTPSQRDDLASMLFARCEKENYGQLLLYRLPAGVPGPYQIENRIDKDTKIIAELALLNSRNSSFTRGNMLVVPIEDSIVYIKPIYQTSAEHSGTPGIKRVIVAYGDDIEIALTLDEAFKKMFGVNLPDPFNNEDITDVIDKVISNFELYKNFTQKGLWEDMGNSLKNLDDSIKELRGYKDELLRDRRVTR